MSRKKNTLFSSKFVIPFVEWAKTFDNKEADFKHYGFDLKPLFSGLTINDSKKDKCKHQARQGNIQKFVQANSAWIKTRKVDSSTVEVSSLI